MNTVLLPQFLDISTAEEFKSLVQKSLDAEAEIAFDGSEVARMTTPAVQILLAAAKSAQKEGKTLSINNPSNIMKQSFKELGLEKELESLNS